MKATEKFDKDIVEYVSSLSALNHKQLTVLAARDTIDKLDPQASGLPSFFRDYAYELNPMPVFIGPDVIKQMSECVATVPSLIHDLLRIYFDNDAESIAEYYGLSVPDAKAMVDFEFHPNFFSRFDLVHTDNDFKILEINMGSKLGGWEIGAFDSLYRNTSHLKALIDQGNKFRYRASLQEYIVQLLQSCVMLNVADDEGVMRIVFLLDESSLGKYVDTKFVGQLFFDVASAMGLTLDVQFAISVDDFSFDQDYLYYQGKRVSAFNNGRETQKDDIDLSAINAVFFKNNLVQTDSPICTMFQDKRNLALLSQLADKNVFSPEQQTIIKRFVPWGATAKFETVSFEGESWDLDVFLNERKDDMVIKQAYGRGQGAGVYVGRYVDDATWRNAISLVLNEPGYFVQEFCEGKEVLSNTNPDQNELNPCDAVWGVFGFNKAFGGAGVRLVSKTLNDDGVINCAKGAQDTIVYEAEE